MRISIKEQGLEINMGKAAHNPLSTAIPMPYIVKKNEVLSDKYINLLGG